MRDFNFHASSEPPRHYDPQFARRFWAVVLAAFVVFVTVFAVIA